VWWPGNGDEAMAEKKLSGGRTQAMGEGEKRGGCMQRKPVGVSSFYRDQRVGEAVAAQQWLT
jgi:hypothetical protein